MDEIWSFLIQTLTASGAALFLLMLKALFRDKLSPRWQFSVWGLLGMVLLIPAGALGRHILIDWPLWIQTVKSAWFGCYEPSVVTAPVPLLPHRFPATLPQWLFAVYFAGVLFFALRYLISYGKLRRILKNGTDVSGLPELREVQKTYGLPVCRAVKVEGLSSAFVCGVIRPVLAMPADRETDRKVLLHELLHLKNRDVIWGIVISCFRCIHWCNPLLWYCANQAMNDMETLCDQRVLEHLEGEQRREYGRILLSMANETYARAPGTTSVANGGTNIRKRIEAIARFKRYPAGMGLVSVCIVLMLISPLVLGTPMNAAEWQIPDTGGFLRDIHGLEAARMRGCSTFGGALDAYAKAVLTENLHARILCMSKPEQEQTVKAFVEADSGEASLHWDSGVSEPVYANGGYWALNLREVTEDRMEALLVLQAARQNGRSGVLRVCTQNVALCREGGRWYVQPMDAFVIREIPDEGPLQYGARNLPSVTYRGTAGDFAVQMELQKVFRPADQPNPQQNPSSIFPAEPRFLLTPLPDLQYDVVYHNYRTSVSYLGDPDRRDSYRQFGISFAEWDPADPRPKLPKADMVHKSGSGGGGEYWTRELYPGWEDSELVSLSGSGTDFRMEELRNPEKIAVDLYLNGALAAQLELQEVQP